jgi:hypothetical protein
VDEAGKHLLHGGVAADAHLIDVVNGWRRPAPEQRVMRKLMPSAARRWNCPRYSSFCVDPADPADHVLAELRRWGLTQASAASSVPGLQIAQITGD